MEIETSLKPWIILSLSIISAVAIYFFLLNLVKRFYRNRESQVISRSVLKAIKYPILFFLFVIALSISLPFFQIDIFAHRLLRRSENILTIIALSWIAIVGIQLIGIIILKKYDLKAKDNAYARKVYTRYIVLEQIAIGFIIAVGIFLILMSFDRFRQLGISLLASAGVVGIIIGFAAQKSISTVVAGIQIALTQPIRLDDYVVVDNQAGKIEEINLTYVVVRAWDNRRLVIPISSFIEQPFENWTLVSTEMSGTVHLHTNYSIPFEALRNELDRILKQTPLWDGRQHQLEVFNATVDSIEIRIVVSAADHALCGDLKVFVREKMIEYIRDNYPESLPMRRVQTTNLRMKDEG
jgi:small-conductance mechanosensitive channel